MRRFPFIAIAVAAGAQLAAAQLSIVDDLPGSYVDISSTGTLLPLGDDDSGTITLPTGNAVLPAGDIVVSNNGGIGFGTLGSTLLAPGNAPIPSNDAFGGGQSLLAFWDDIGNTIGGIFYQPQSDRFIVQWDQKPIGRADAVSFQVQIFYNAVGSPPVYAQFLYADIESAAAGGGASATIGYQDGGAGFNDVQWSYNSPGAVKNGDVLSLIPEPTSLAALLLLTPALRRRR